MTFGWIIVATQQRFLPPKKKPSRKDPRFSCCFWAFVTFLFQIVKLCSFPFSNLYMFFPDFSVREIYIYSENLQIHPSTLLLLLLFLLKVWSTKDFTHFLFSGRTWSSLWCARARYLHRLDDGWCEDQLPPIWAESWFRRKRRSLVC